MAVRLRLRRKRAGQSRFPALQGVFISDLHKLGKEYFTRQQYDSASMVLTVAISKENNRLSEQDVILLSEAHNMLGIINFSNTNYAGAYSHFLRGMQLYDVPDAAGYSNLAAVYLYYGDTPRAYECLKKVLDGAIERRHSYHAAIALVSILTLDLGSTMIPPDSIRGLIASFKSIPEADRDNRGFPVADAMADAYLLSRAGRHLDSARKLKALLGNLGRMTLPARDIHSVYTLIAKEYDYANMRDSALAYLDRAQHIAAVNDFKELLATTYRDKMNLLAENGDPVNSEFYRIKMLELNDSLFNPRELGKIRDIQISYETDTFEKRLEVMKVKEHMWRVIFLIVLAAFMAVSILTVILFRKNKAIRDKNKHLFQYKTSGIISDVTPDEKSRRIESESVKKEPVNPNVESGLSGDPTAQPDEADPEYEIGSEDTNERIDRRKYTSSALTEETRQPILERIKEVFRDESLFCRENFSLQSLATLCDSNQRYVSQVINETMGKNFASLLNEKRIDAACRRLMDIEHYGNLTIEAVVSEVGFKSRSTFSKTFKRLTGLTPGEFQRMARLGEQEEAED